MRMRSLARTAPRTTPGQPPVLDGMKAASKTSASSVGGHTNIKPPPNRGRQVNFQKKTKEGKKERGRRPILGGGQTTFLTASTARCPGDRLEISRHIDLRRTAKKKKKKTIKPRTVSLSNWEAGDRFAAPAPSPARRPRLCCLANPPRARAHLMPPKDIIHWRPNHRHRPRCLSQMVFRFLGLSKIRHHNHFQAPRRRRSGSAGCDIFPSFFSVTCLSGAGLTRRDEFWRAFPCPVNIAAEVDHPARIGAGPMVSMGSNDAKLNETIWDFFGQRA